MNLVTRQCLRILQGNVRNQKTHGLRVSSFRSALSLENFYPESKLKLHTPTFVSITDLFKNTNKNTNKIDHANMLFLLLFIINCYILSNITSMSTERDDCCAFTFQVPDPEAKFSGYIPLNKVQITYSGSSGPGGQNVNCVNTKVDLRFQVANATWLSEEIRTKLTEQVSRIVNKILIDQFKL